MIDGAVVYAIDEGICTVTLNRPEALNAMRFSMIQALIDAIDRADRDDAVRVIVLAAEGRVFCAGTDLGGTGGYGAGREGYKPMQGGRRDSGGELAMRIFDAAKPVIAAINGPAVGIGSTMLLPTDIRIASTKASFGFPFVRRGIVPESCSSWFLPRMVGVSRALAWTVTGRKIDAQEALAADAKEGVAAFKDKRPPDFASCMPRDTPGFMPWWPAQHFDE